MRGFNKIAHEISVSKRYIRNIIEVLEIISEISLKRNNWITIIEIHKHSSLSINTVRKIIADLYNIKYLSCLCPYNSRNLMFKLIRYICGSCGSNVPPNGMDCGRCGERLLICMDTAN